MYLFTGLTISKFHSFSTRTMIPTKFFTDERQVIQKGEIKNNCEVDVRYILYCMIHEGKFASFPEVGRRRRVRVRVNLDKNG